MQIKQKNKNPINLIMEHKYKSKIMNQKFFKSISLIKLVLFLFLGIWSTNVSAQCSPDIDPNYSSCTGDSIQITAAPGFNYSWSTGETTQSIWVLTSDSVWVVITDSICGADSSSFFTPTIVTILDPTISPSDTTICFGDSITLCTGNTTSTGLLNQVITVTRLQDIISGAPLKADFPEDNDWHYVVITKDSQSSLEGKIYIDGQLAATGAWQNQGYSYNSLYLGAHEYMGWNEHLKGWLDEVRVSNVVRSATEIANYYSSSTTFSVDANTLGLWHMDETSGTTFANSVSGNGDLFNGASFVNGQFGNAVYFDGIDDRGNCNINIPEYSLTLEYWVKLDGIQHDITIMQPYGMYSSNNYLLVDTITNPTYIWSTGDTGTTVTVDPSVDNIVWVTNGICTDTIYFYNNFATVYDTIYTTISDTNLISVTDTLVINVVLTGIPSPNNTNTINVYPNPALDHITIDNGDFANMGGYSIVVANTLGQVVFQSIINQQQFYIDLNTWMGTGTYIISIIDAVSNTIDTRTIIVQ